MILKQIGLENVVAQIAIRYLYFLSLGILPLLLFSIVRTFLDTLGNDATIDVLDALALAFECLF